MKLKNLIRIALIVPLLVATGVGAQQATQTNEVCPVLHVCVEYDDTAIAIDPLQGPVQAVVVQEETITTTTFSGTEVTSRATLAVWIASGDTFSYVDDLQVEQVGAFAGAELGDVYQLAKAAE